MTDVITLGDHAKKSRLRLYDWRVGSDNRLHIEVYEPQSNVPTRSAHDEIATRMRMQFGAKEDQYRFNAPGLDESLGLKTHSLTILDAELAQKVQTWAQKEKPKAAPKLLSAPPERLFDAIRGPIQTVGKPDAHVYEFVVAGSVERVGELVRGSIGNKPGITINPELVTVGGVSCRRVSVEGKAALSFAELWRIEKQKQPLLEEEMKPDVARTFMNSVLREREDGRGGFFLEIEVTQAVRDRAKQGKGDLKQAMTDHLSELLHRARGINVTGNLPVKVDGKPVMHVHLTLRAASIYESARDQIRAEDGPRHH